MTPPPPWHRLLRRSGIGIILATLAFLALATTVGLSMLHTPALPDHQRPPPLAPHRAGV